MVSKTVKNAREKSGMTQQEIADKAGVSRTYYADVERGRYTPSLKLLSRLGNIMDIDLIFAMLCVISCHSKKFLKTSYKKGIIANRGE